MSTRSKADSPTLWLVWRQIDGKERIVATAECQETAQRIARTAEALTGDGHWCVNTRGYIGSKTVADLCKLLKPLTLTAPTPS